MKQLKALYCMTVGYIAGACLNKTNNYELSNKGYSFKTNFTPITFVNVNNLNQPVNYAGQTYFFGFDPQALQRTAALTKKDLEDALQAEANWVNLTRKKLQSGWEKATAAVTLETQLVDRTSDVPAPVPDTSQSNAVAPATAPSMADETTSSTTEKPAPTAPAATPSAPTPASPETPKAEPETGDVGRKVKTYRIFVASAKAEAQGSLSVGYTARLEDTETGECIEIEKSGYTKDYGKMIPIALAEAFESGFILPCSKNTQSVVTIYVANEFIANMFAKNFLRNFAKNNWNKKDGKPLANKDEWVRIWTHASHMMVSGVLCEPTGDVLKDLFDKAKSLAEADYQKRYGLIGPGK